jgi:hypothetical protein
LRKKRRHHRESNDLVAVQRHDARRAVGRERLLDQRSAGRRDLVRGRQPRVALPVARVPLGQQRRCSVQMPARIEVSDGDSHRPRS